jgi:hypothetical protein
MCYHRVMSNHRSWPTAGIGKEAYDALAEGLSPSELWSLLLEVLERRATSRTPAQLLQQWERDGFGCGSGLCCPARHAAADRRAIPA